jgi:hypothetical protein
MPGELTAKKEVFMKKTSKTSKNGKTDVMLPHYDFSNGVRGKHYKKYREGVTVHLTGEQTDSKVVVLDDDMGKIFPDSKSVNDALRHLVKAVPKARAA